MTIRLVSHGQTGEFFLDGRLDSNTAPEAEEIFAETLPRFDNITLDLENLEYISSAGLRVFKRLYMDLKKKGGILTVKNTQEMIMEVFEMTGFVSLFRFA